MSRLILFIDPIWDCPLLCEEDHWSCTASDHLYSCANTRHVGDCPVCFGPWGAWRAVLGQIVPVCDEWGFLLAGQPTRIAALSPASYDYFRAVGWSP